MIVSEGSARMEIQKDGSYLIVTDSGETYHFDKEKLLNSVTDKVRGKVSLYYDKGKLVRIENRCGRIELKYERNRIIKVVDVSGRHVDYKYENDALVKVRNINGNVIKLSKKQKSKVS